MESSLGLQQNLEPDRESEANPEGQSSTEETIGDMTESEDVTYFQHVLLKELFYETRGSHIPQVCSVRNQPDDSATSSANASSNQCHEEKEKLPSKIECDLYSYLLPYFASKVGEMKTPFVNLQAKIADCEELQLVFSYKDKKAVKNIIQVYKELVKNLIIREIVFDVKSDRDLFKFIERKNCSRGWGTNNSHVYISTCAIEEGKVSVFGFDDKSINEAQQWLKSHVSDSGITARTLSVLVQQPPNKEKKYKINQRGKKQKRLELSAISLEIDSKNFTERRGIEEMSVAERKSLTEENRKMKSMPDHQTERDSEAILSITESDLCADSSLENSDQVFLEAVVIVNHYWIMDFGTRELKRACDRNHVKVIESEYSSGKAKIILKGTLIDLLAVQKALDNHAKMITSEPSNEIECSANSAKSKEVISEQADEKKNLANKKVTENASKGARRKEYKTFHADESNHNELGNLEPSSLPFINNNDKNSEETVTSETFEDTTGHSTAQSNSAQGNSGDKNFAESNRIKEIERRNSNSNHSDEDHENSSSDFSGQQSDNRSSVSVHGKKDVKTQIPISEQPRKRFADDSQLSGNLSGRYDGNPFNESSDQIKSLEGTRYCHRSGVMTADVTNTIRGNNSADKSQEDSKLKGDSSVSPRDAKLELRSERILEGSGAGVMEVHSPPPLAKSESDLSGSESASDSEDMTNKMHKSNKSSLPSEESKGAEDEESERNKQEKLTGMQPLQSDGDFDNEATTGNATNTNFQSDPVEKLSGDMLSQKLNTEKTAVPVAKERKKRKDVKEMMSGARVEDQEAGDDINVVSDNINLKKPEKIDLQKTIKITKSKKDLLKQQTNSENDKNSNDKTKAEDGVDNGDQTANRNDSQYFQNRSEVNKDYRHNSTGEINQNLEELKNQKQMDSASHPAGHENMEVDSDGFVVANSNRDGTDTAEDDGKVIAKKEEVKPGNVGRYNSRRQLQGTLDERRELDNAATLPIRGRNQSAESDKEKSEKDRMDVTAQGRIVLDKIRSQSTKDRSTNSSRNRSGGSSKNYKRSGDHNRHSNQYRNSAHNDLAAYNYGERLDIRDYDLLQDSSRGTSGPFVSNLDVDEDHFAAVLRAEVENDRLCKSLEVTGVCSSHDDVTQLRSLGSSTTEISRSVKKNNNSSDKTDALKTKFLSGWTNLRNGWVVKTATNFKLGTMIWLLGELYLVDREDQKKRDSDPPRGSEDKSSFDRFRLDFESRIWMTYRQDFPQLLGTNHLTSDVGWGCMIRSGQMMLAQTLINHALGRRWRLTNAAPDELRTQRRIIRYFGDSKSEWFSIHTLTTIGSLRVGKEAGDWYGPSSVALVLRDAVQEANLFSGDDLLRGLFVHVAIDSTDSSEPSSLPVCDLSSTINHTSTRTNSAFSTFTVVPPATAVPSGKLSSSPRTSKKSRNPQSSDMILAFADGGGNFRHVSSLVSEPKERKSSKKFTAVARTDYSSGTASGNVTASCSKKLESAIVNTYDRVVDTTSSDRVTSAYSVTTGGVDSCGVDTDSLDTGRSSCAVSTGNVNGLTTDSIITGVVGKENLMTDNVTADKTATGHAAVDTRPCSALQCDQVVSCTNTATHSNQHQSEVSCANATGLKKMSAEYNPVQTDSDLYNKTSTNCDSDKTGFMHTDRARCSPDKTCFDEVDSSQHTLLGFDNTNGSMNHENMAKSGPNTETYSHVYNNTHRHTPTQPVQTESDINSQAKSGYNPNTDQTGLKKLNVKNNQPALRCCDNDTSIRGHYRPLPSAFSNINSAQEPVKTGSAATLEPVGTGSAGDRIPYSRISAERTVSETASYNGSDFDFVTDANCTPTPPAHTSQPPTRSKSSKLSSFLNSVAAGISSVGKASHRHGSLTSEDDDESDWLAVSTDLPSSSAPSTRSNPSLPHLLDLWPTEDYGGDQAACSRISVGRVEEPGEGKGLEREGNTAGHYVNRKKFSRVALGPRYDTRQQCGMDSLRPDILLMRPDTLAELQYIECSSKTESVSKQNATSNSNRCNDSAHNYNTADLNASPSNLSCGGGVNMKSNHQNLEKECETSGDRSGEDLSHVKRENHITSHVNNENILCDNVDMKEDHFSQNSSKQCNDTSNICSDSNVNKITDDFHLKKPSHVDNHHIKDQPNSATYHVPVFEAQQFSLTNQDAANISSTNHSNDNILGSTNQSNANKPWRSLLLLIPVRLGGTTLNAAYWPCVQRILAHKMCVGIIGGRPKHSLYFIGWQDDKLLHLDPHCCQDRVDTAQPDFPIDTYHCSYPRKMLFSKMDPSCTVGFYCKTKEDFDQLVKDAPLLTGSSLGASYSVFRFESGRRSDAEKALLAQLERRGGATSTIDMNNRRDSERSNDFLFI